MLMTKRQKGLTLSALRLVQRTVREPGQHIFIQYDPIPAQVGEVAELIERIEDGSVTLRG